MTLTGYKTAGDTAIDAAADLAGVTSAARQATAGMFAVVRDLANARGLAHNDLTNALATYVQANYTPENWTTLTGFKTAGDTAIDAAADLAAVSAAQNTATTGMASVQTIAQTLVAAKVTAKDALTIALANYTQANYTSANWTTLTGFKTAGDTAIDAAANLAAVNAAQNTATTGMAGVVKDLYNAKVNAKGVLTTALATYTEGNYSPANWTTLTGFKTAGDTAIDAAADLAAVSAAQIAATTGMAGVKTIAQETKFITASAGLHGTITPVGDVAVAPGANQAFVIEAAPNYHVADVLVDNLSVGAVTNYPFTNVTANHTIIASFEINNYTVVYDGNGSTSGTVPTDASSPYDYNSTVTVLDNTGLLAKTGYSFVGWNTAADGNGTDYSSTATFAMGDANVTLYAKWSLLPPAIVSTRVFYNNSTWDGDADASANDDLAIATDKAVLLAGGTATFANYTSYTKGINGIMIDVLNLPSTPAADDFTFKTGNNNTPADWSAAAVPTITTRVMVDNVTRITLIWADNSIKKTWLQVTVKANPATTGLNTPYVFYFGNAPSDCGNSPTDAMVNATDQLAARSHTTGTDLASITDKYDYNRDKTVDNTDVVAARNSATSPVTMLNLIKP
jgi:uncharacterized repeat protein (TIGR02543 family)